MLASVAEQANLSLTWPETPKDTFSHDEAQVFINFAYFFFWVLQTSEVMVQIAI